MGESYYLGVDLGGTQLRLAAVTEAGHLVTEVLTVATGKDFGPDDLRRQLRRLLAEAQAKLHKPAIAALGFGTPGVFHQRTLAQASNLPRLNGTDIEALAREAAGCPVRIENDARCFTLAEARYGAGRGARHLCGITLGTGLGCGVMIDGQLHRGITAQAGEVWRIPLRDHHCEYYLSGAGIVRGYASLKGASDSQIDSARIAQLARAGEAAASAAWRSFADDLYALCEMVISLLEPEVIVLGGSLTEARDLYEEALTERLAARATRLAFAELGSAAGVIGAAALNINAH
jgi:predicted NBD/HSP70 family sugar kinase